jgi:hypothetical protein
MKGNCPAMKQTLKVEHRNTNLVNLTSPTMTTAPFGHGTMYLDYGLSILKVRNWVNRAQRDMRTHPSCY